MRHRTRPGAWLACAALLCASAFNGCTAPSRLATASAAAPIPPGAARIWFYRDFEPSISLNDANVSLNGAEVAYVPPDGSASYRDVPPGHYHITVLTYGTDVNQDKAVDLAAGQEAFVKILAAGEWLSGGDMSHFRRDTFYVSLVPPQIARSELAARPLTGG